MPPVSKKTRCRISNKQKKEICEFAKKNPIYKQHEVANEFMERYPSLKIDRSTVSKILKKADEYQLQDDDINTEKTFRRRPKKGQQFAQAFSIPKGSIAFSNGWATRFKRHNGIKKITMHGEAASAPLESLPEERKKLQELLSCYNPEDIYNADETGLFYRLLSNQTLSKKPMAGKKKATWMRSDIWEQWLRYIDDGFRIQGRQVLLLVDNAASHITPGTNNISEVQNDDTDELSPENDSFDEIEELQEESQERSRGRS
ncbi:hypothetical protein Glove_347g14 [Diversispora epigaea]|uniref:DDE-1 domain-containing protein n=1 Tax=Diversispora epigaea TaxID=1348612 RepID=A0A397HLY3_9GLOM|nr:hypothetical protein Glove_347g14 [Diversispora epigaea]